MIKLFKGTRIYLDEDTNVKHEREFVILWEIITCIEDASASWIENNEAHVTCFRTVDCEAYHVRIDFEKAIKLWQKYVDKSPVLLGLN